MIAMISRFKNNKMTYELSEGKDICYIGRILCPTQINYLRTYGNTVISFSLYKKLGEAKIIEEIKELTGLEVFIDIHEHEIDEPSVIIKAFGEFKIKLMPSIILDINKHKNYYIVYFGKKEAIRFSKKNLSLTEVKELLRNNGVYDYEVR